MQYDSLASWAAPSHPNRTERVAECMSTVHSGTCTNTFSTQLGQELDVPKIPINFGEQVHLCCPQLGVVPARWANAAPGVWRSPSQQPPSRSHMRIAPGAMRSTGASRQTRRAHTAPSPVCEKALTATERHRRITATANHQAGLVGCATGWAAPRPLPRPLPRPRPRAMRRQIELAETYTH